MDDTTFPLRPVDEPGLEDVDTAGTGKYADYGSGGVVQE
jgi:hypothetical protein